MDWPPARERLGVNCFGVLNRSGSTTVRGNDVNLGSIRKIGQQFRLADDENWSRFDDRAGALTLIVIVP